MWLIEWLSGKWDVISDWFSGSYWTLRNRIKTLPNSLAALRNTIIHYYNLAANLIRPRIDAFHRAVVKPVLDWLDNQIKILVRRLADTWERITRVTSQIGLDIAAAGRTLTQWVQSRYDNLIVTLNRSVDHIRLSTIPALANRLNTLLPFVTWLRTVSGILSPGWLRDMIAYVNNTRNTVSIFVSNPLQFILGILWSNGLEFLSYLIGYGMGAVDARLPPIPLWGNPATPKILPIPGGAGGIANPLARMYISGFLFTPGHWGIDLGLVRGEYVFAAHDGVITHTGWSSVGYGEYIDLAGEVYWSRYAHLQGYAVVRGQEVRQGQLIGYGNDTGNSTGDHLHFELKINGQYVDPLHYITLTGR